MEGKQRMWIELNEGAILNFNHVIAFASSNRVITYRCVDDTDMQELFESEDEALARMQQLKQLLLGE